MRCSQSLRPEMPRLLRIPKACQCFHWNLPQPVVSLHNTCLRQMLVLYTYLGSRFLEWSVPSNSPTKMLYVSSPMRATCHVNLSLLPSHSLLHCEESNHEAPRSTLRLLRYFERVRVRVFCAGSRWTDLPSRESYSCLKDS
jgi:hypothetical protein